MDPEERSRLRQVYDILLEQISEGPINRSAAQSRPLWDAFFWDLGGDARRPGEARLCTPLLDPAAPWYPHGWWSDPTCYAWSCRAPEWHVQTL